MLDLVFQYLPIFLLVLCRITAFLVTVPVFSSRGIPIPFKIGLSVYMALIVFLGLQVTETMSFDLMYLMEILKEVMIGLLMGFVAYLFFTIVQIAGSFVDLQMGFGIVNVIDPMTGAQSPILGNFNFIFAMLLFLAMDGHHHLIRGIMESFEQIPVTTNVFADIASGQLSTFMIHAFASAFYLAFQFAAPMIAALFLLDVALGMLARTSPQFNVFVVGIPIKIMMGLAVLLMMIPTLLFLFQHVFGVLFGQMEEMMRLLRPPAT